MFFFSIHFLIPFKPRSPKLAAIVESTTMTDAEAEKVLNDMVNFKIQEADLLKKYASEFKKVLPVKKVVLLFKAENDFKRELLKKLSQRNRN